MESRVEVKDLKVGMFVSDLDRPWQDTPFLLQGFLIEDDGQIRQLQQHCRFVMVDRVRSVGDEFAAPAAAVAVPVPAVGPVAASLAGRNPSAAKPLAAPPPTEAGGGLLDGLLERVLGIPGRIAKRFAGRRAALPEDAVQIAPESDREATPEGPPPVYPDVRIVEEEIGTARDTFERTSDILQKLTSDVRAGQPVQVERVEEVVDEMVESMVRNPDALMWVARLREQDRAVYGHGLQVAVYLVAFGRHLGFPKHELSRLGIIGLLLDIGKIRVPRELLEKRGQLSSAEFETVKAHVAHSLAILGETPGWAPEVLEGIAQHHERMNGSGYPEGLRDSEIGLFGRMAGIADCFAALTASRPYAEAVSSYEALRMISSWGGELFHAPLAEQFVQAIGVFPVGSLVELSSGEVAVVVSHNKVRRLKPRVLVLTAADKTRSARPVMVDLLHEPGMGGAEPPFIRRSLPSGAYGLDPRENYLS